MLQFLGRRRKRLTREEYRERVKFTDDFFFSRVMQDEDLCRRLAEVLLGVKIKSVTLHQTQRTLKRERHTHGIRLDAYLEDENRIVAIEMQTANQKSLFKRIRLYQGMLDTATLPAGSSYMSLKNTYIIFLCTFDPVGKGLPMYTVRQTYVETDEKDYDDGTCRILYNAPAWELCTDDEVRAVLQYMQTGFAEAGLMQDIDTAIENERKLQAMRSEYMTFDMRLCEVRDETREETWEEAWEEAWEECSHEKALQTARNLIAMGLPLEQIAQAVGLTLEEVSSLGAAAGANTDQRTLQQIIDQRAEDRVEENKMLWLAQGTRENKIETAKRALQRGFSADVVSELTGLSIEDVRALL